MWARGPWKQVSRLGNPLINEVVIPTVKKDYWNSQKPYKDSQLEVLPQTGARGGRQPLSAALDPPATSNRADSWRPADRGQHPGLADRPGRPPVHPNGPQQGRDARVNTGIKPNRRGMCFGTDGGRPAGSEPWATCAASRTAVVSSTTSPTSKSAPSSRDTAHPQRGPRRPEQDPQQRPRRRCRCQRPAVPDGLPVHRDAAAGLRARPRARPGRSTNRPPIPRERPGLRPGRLDSRTRMIRWRSR